MKKYIFPSLVVLGFAGLVFYGKILSDRSDELRGKQAKQEMILLKQSEILAVNTAMLQIVASSLPAKHKTVTGKEGLKMDAMP